MSEVQLKVETAVAPGSVEFVWCRPAFQPPVDTKTAVPEAARHRASQPAKTSV